MNSANVVATNVIAGSILESLKSGLQIKGIVLSYAREGVVGKAWVAIEFAGIGLRQVAVHCEHKLEAGEEVELKCVPNPVNPGHHMFQVVSTPSEK